jgi:hypothetical protein
VQDSEDGLPISEFESDKEIRETLHFTEFKSVREPRGIDDSASESGELVDIENK